MILSALIIFLYFYTNNYFNQLELPFSKKIEKKETGVTKDDKIKIERILVPIDGSDCSIRAAKFAVEIAKSQNAQLFLIYVLDQFPYGYEFSGYGVEDFIQNVENQANIWFSEIQSFARENGVDVTKSEVLRDYRSIVDAIIHYSTVHSVSLIVIATRGRTGIQRVVMGSIANGVSQHAHCPVLLVR